mmetsp:Transcript_20756/g.38607  ORF Transcript_20756/g.38607 Transcript_20756/m.38607 type:complete len:308 (-) Transcript_20756:182-1105(-)
MALITFEFENILGELQDLRTQLSAETLVKEGLALELQKSKAEVEDLVIDVKLLSSTFASQRRGLHSQEESQMTATLKANLKDLESSQEAMKSVLVKAKNELTDQLNKYQALLSSYEKINSDNQGLRSETCAYASTVKTLEKQRETQLDSFNTSRELLEGQELCLMKEGSGLKEVLRAKTEAFASEVATLKSRYQAELKAGADAHTYKMTEAALEDQCKVKQMRLEVEATEHLASVSKAEVVEIEARNGSFKLQIQAQNEDKEQVRHLSNKLSIQDARSSTLACAACYLIGIVVYILTAHYLRHIRVE